MCFEIVFGTLCCICSIRWSVKSYNSFHQVVVTGLRDQTWSCQWNILPMYRRREVERSTPTKFENINLLQKQAIRTVAFFIRNSWLRFCFLLTPKDFRIYWILLKWILDSTTFVLIYSQITWDLRMLIGIYIGEFSQFHRFFRKIGIQIQILKN